MSEANSFFVEEYNFSRDSIFSLDEYTQEFSAHAHEVEMFPHRTFLIAEYASTPIKTTVIPLNDAIDTLDQVTTLTKEIIGSASPMHFKGLCSIR